MVISVLTVIFFFSDDAYSGDLRRSGGDGDKLPGAQRQLRRELAGDMPAVLGFLPEGERSSGGGVRGRGVAHSAGADLRRISQETLTEVKKKQCLLTEGVCLDGIIGFYFIFIFTCNISCDL